MLVTTAVAITAITDRVTGGWERAMDRAARQHESQAQRGCGDAPQAEGTARTGPCLQRQAGMEGRGWIRLAHVGLRKTKVSISQSPHGVSGQPQL